jgi:hypothetical protein
MQGGPIGLDEQHLDAKLLRPAVDPTIPPAARDLLLASHAAPSGETAPGETASSNTASGETASGETAPGPQRPGLLPRDPEPRLATVDGAATGLSTGMFAALTGVLPWAVGILIFQGAMGWQSAAGRYALLLIEMIVAVTFVVFGSRVARVGQARGRLTAAAVAQAYHGRYLTGADLDAPARVLLRRAQEAVDVATQAAVSQAGLLDEVPALAAQEWDIAVSLREQARLRAKRTEITQATQATQAAPAAGTAGQATATEPADAIAPTGTTQPTGATAHLLRQHLDAAQTAEQSVTDRVAALERFAAEVGEADAAYRDWQARARLAELIGPHLEMLARTAADAHGIAELTEMTGRARAIADALRDDEQPNDPQPAHRPGNEQPNDPQPGDGQPG